MTIKISYCKFKQLLGVKEEASKTISFLAITNFLSVWFFNIGQSSKLVNSHNETVNKKHKQDLFTHVVYILRNEAPKKKKKKNRD